MHEKHNVSLSALVGAGTSDTAVFTNIAKAGKVNVKVIKNFVKISALTLSLVFSLNSFGYKDIINCDHFNRRTYSDTKRYIKRHNPDDIHPMRIMALSAFCIGKEKGRKGRKRKEKEGLEVLKRLFSMGDIPSTYLLGKYYASGGIFKWQTPGQEDYRKNLNIAIYYFEEAAGQIMLAVNYPEGVNPDHPGLEDHYNHPGLEDNYTISAKVFLGLLDLYYERYMKGVENSLDSKREKKVSYIDGIVTLVKMRDWSERCLKIFALDMWQTYPAVANAMKANCQARNNFAVQVLPLERRRIKVLLDMRIKYQDVVNQIIQLHEGNNR